MEVRFIPDKVDVPLGSYADVFPRCYMLLSLLLRPIL